jgi:phosphoribosylcarboxyaminoimidazole (NCAIR) mutase
MTKAKAPLLASIDEYFDPGAHGCSKHSIAQECAVNLLDRYCQHFTGINFDPRRDGTEPRWDPDRITSSDLYAVAALSMSDFIEPKNLERLRKAFFDDHALSVFCGVAGCAAHLHCILKRVPADSSIFSPTAARDLSTLTTLWDEVQGRTKLPPCSLLVNRNILGTAGLSKLLARKRSALAPIIDSVALARVKRANRGASPASNWSFMMTEFQGSASLVANINAVQTTSTVPPWVTELRIVDIVVWMRDQYGC